MDPAAVVRAHRARRLALGVALCGVLAGAVSCALGLDPSRLDAETDGGATSPDADGKLSDGGGDGDADVSIEPPPAACATDDDCKTAHACLRGTCDPSQKRCVFDVCRPAACASATCDANDRVCGESKAYKYKAAQFKLDATLACTGCVAAVHPWLFAATSLGVVALDVSNPASTSPREVPIVGLGFVPAHLVQSGARVWMIGEASGAGPTRIPLAYIDPPTDPFATQIEAHTVLATYNRPAEAVALFAQSDGSALLVGPSSAQYPAAVADVPLVEPVSITATALPFTKDTGPVAASGKRLLMAGLSNGGAAFYFIDDVGSTSPTREPSTNLVDAGTLTSARVFAYGPGGAVFWATGVRGSHGDPPEDFTKLARAQFLVANETAAVEGKDSVELEAYDDSVAANAAVFGPASAALIDPDTAIVATASPENTAQTSVQFVRRSPLAVIEVPDGGAPRRHVLPISVKSVVGAAGSNGIGYLVANDPSGSDASATVYVFDPACAP